MPSMRVVSISFQSTLPVGGATAPGILLYKDDLHFNPRSPWGERPVNFWQNILSPDISIHAPRGGSDFETVKKDLQTVYISIHAPRGGSD